MDGDEDLEDVNAGLVSGVKTSALRFLVICSPCEKHSHTTSQNITNVRERGISSAGNTGVLAFFQDIKASATRMLRKTGK